MITSQSVCCYQSLQSGGWTGTHRCSGWGTSSSKPNSDMTNLDRFSFLKGFFFLGLGERRVLETAYFPFLGNHSASPQATNADPSGAGREVLSPLVEELPPGLVTPGGKLNPFPVDLLASRWLIVRSNLGATDSESRTTVKWERKRNQVPLITKPQAGTSMVVQWVGLRLPRQGVLD